MLRRPTQLKVAPQTQLRRVSAVQGTSKGGSRLSRRQDLPALRRAAQRRRVRPQQRVRARDVGRSADVLGVRRPREQTLSRREAQLALIRSCHQNQAGFARGRGRV